MRYEPEKTTYILPRARKKKEKTWRGDALELREKIFKLARYGQSKLANILYARELARRYPQLTAVSIHPGVVKTEGYAQLSFAIRMIAYVTNPFSMKTPAQGEENQLWAATSDKTKIDNGAFYTPVGAPGAAPSKDELARQLWEWTDKELEGYEV